MRLLCGIAVVSLVLTTGCGDSTTAPSRPSYVLNAVDGKGLPIVYQGVDTGSKLVWGTLSLDGAGHATIVNGYYDWGVIGGFTSSNRTETLTAAYTVVGDSIRLNHPTSDACHGQPCFQPPDEVGFFSDTLVTLATVLGTSKGPVYYYYMMH
jgi:hypothetical protein